MLKEYDLALENCDYGTDLDAAIRFADAVKDKLRFAPGLGWLHWDGKRWAPDTEKQSLEESKNCARGWTSRWVNSNDPNRESRVKQAFNLEGASHIKAAVDLAQSDPRLVLNHERLDADPWAFNVENGTLDLKTGILRPHDRADLISKLAPVVYAADARHETLDRVVATLDESTPGMAEFLSRCTGASISGDATTECLFVIQGDGASGKTTLSEAVAAMAGDYAVKIPFESICLAKHGRSPGAASPDLVGLRASRFAYASEGDQSAKLDAGIVKTLTGGEPFTARGLFQSPITFPQTWKLWLVSNYDPRADADDTGLWRRLVKIHFKSVPVERRDPLVKETLVSDPAARSALLAWAVRGCMAWRAAGRGRKGLEVPAAVAAVTDAYRQKQDTLAQWFDSLMADGARLDVYGRASVKDVREHYESWCEDEGASPCYNKRFNDFCESRGLKRTRGTGGTKQWQGIEIPS